MDANVKNFEIELLKYKTHNREITQTEESRSDLDNKKMYEKRLEVSKEFLI